MHTVFRGLRDVGNELAAVGDDPQARKRQVHAVRDRHCLSIFIPLIAGA